MHPPNLTIRLLQAQDIQPIAAAFAQHGWHKPASQYERYLVEQESGTREVWVAFIADQFAGYVCILWHSDYQPFAQAAIPEIADFNVLPAFRRRQIGSRLLDKAEARIASRSPVVGIGVGMTADYGAAQRMYVLRGYVPDGRGLAHNGRPLPYGEQVTVGDELALYFTRPVG